MCHCGFTYRQKILQRVLSVAVGCDQDILIGKMICTIRKSLFQSKPFSAVFGIRKHGGTVQSGDLSKHGIKPTVTAVVDHDQMIYRMDHLRGVLNKCVRRFISRDNGNPLHNIHLSITKALYFHGNGILSIVFQLEFNFC